MPATPVRVLRIIARLNIGGPAIHATLLTERLDALGYETTLVAGIEEPGEGSYLELRPVPLRDLHRISQLRREIRGLHDLVALARLVRLIRSVRPQIVDTHTAKAGTLGRLAAWICGVPIVVHTYHGHVFRGYFSPAKTRVFVAIDRALARVTHQLVAVSPTVREELLALGIGEAARFEVIPLGLDLSPFLQAETLRGRLRTELGVAGDVPIVGIVARLAPIKDHECFLAVAALVARQLPDVHFLIVGDGERRAELEALAGRMGVGARTHFLGWRGDLAAIYADLDLLVLTSRNEGSPVALIEAMASARPVVAMRVGGVGDVVDHGRTGILVEPDDQSGMASAIVDLLRDHDHAAAIARAARAHVAGLYTADRVVRDVDALYRRLLADRSC